MSYNLWWLIKVVSEWQYFACKYFPRFHSSHVFCLTSVFSPFCWIEIGFGWRAQGNEWVRCVKNTEWPTSIMIFFPPFSQLAITFRKALDISITAAQPIFEEANHFQNITSFIYTDNTMIVAILVLYTSMTALEHTSVNWRMTLIFLYTHFLLLLSMV